MKQKKYMIRCDIEGVSGVVSYQQAEPGKSEFLNGQRWFMSDLTALIDGLNDGGAHEIHVYDEHYYGRNIHMDNLPPNVLLYCGKPPYTKDNAGGLNSDFEGLILLGFHSKRGTENALLNHTYEPDIKNIILNGVSVGEIGMEAAIAGDYDVPLMMVTADSKGVEEAAELISGVRSVCVKQSLSEFGAICLPLSKTREMIYNTAKSIVKDPPLVKPYKLSKDITLHMEFFDTPYAKLYMELYGSNVIKGSTVTECWAKYWSNKLKVGGLL